MTDRRDQDTPAGPDGDAWADAWTPSKGDLGRLALRGGALSLSVQLSRFLLQLAGLVVLARLLAPDDFGVFAMALAVTGFVGMVNTVGFSLHTVQKADLTSQDVSNAFWLTMAGAVVLAGLTAAAAPLIAMAYGEPRVAAVVVALSTGIVAQALYAQQEALLSRAMHFGRLVAVQLPGFITGFATAVVLGFDGHGYWALVAIQLVPHLVSAALAWLLVDWRPTRLRRDRNLTDIFRFGGYLSAFNMVNYVQRNADDVLLGWRFGSQVLGPYTLAYRLLLVPAQVISFPINRVAVPTLARLVDQPEAFRRAWRGALEFLLLGNLPVAVAGLFLSYQLIEVMAGPQWSESARIFAWLAAAIVPQALHNSLGILFLATGRTDRMFRWSCFAMPVSVLGFLIGLQWGGWGVAVSFAATQTLLLLPGFHYALATAPTRLGDAAAAARRPLMVAALIAGLLAIASLEAVAPDGAVAQLCLGAALTIAGFFAGAVAAYGPRAVRDILTLRGGLGGLS